MSLTTPQLIQHYEENAQRAALLRERYTLFMDWLDDQREQLRTEARAAHLTLARAYLLALSQPALARAERLTGFRGFTRRDPLRAMARELARLQKHITRIQADERYRQRTYLVGPQGKIALKLQEARDMLAPWEYECAKFEQLDGFLELLDIGYDTPDFGEKWWSASYWKHWALGDRICEALSLDDFGDDVLPAWEKASDPRTRWRAAVAEIEAAIEAVHELVRTHDEAAGRIPQLPALYLEQCQQLLAQFLEQADPALLNEWLGDEDDRGVLMGLRRAAGLAAKVEFLTEMYTFGVASVHGDLGVREEKYRRKINKFRRSKYAYSSFPETYLDVKFAARVPKLEDRVTQLDKLARRVIGYDRYDRFDLSNDPELWWREFTGGRPPRQLPRLRSWYDKHPSARPTLEREDAAGAVADAAAWQDEAADLGYLS